MSEDYGVPPSVDLTIDPNILVASLSDVCPSSGCLERGIRTDPSSEGPRDESRVRFDYDEYTRYVSNLNHMYGRIDRRAEVVSTIRDFGRGHRGHSLSVYIGGIGQTLSLQEQEAISILSSRCSTENQGAWIVMDLTLDVVYKSKVIPKAWIRDILPLIKKPSEYIDDNYLFWKIDGCEGICLSCPQSNERLVSTRYLSLLDELLQLYEQGSLSDCSPEFARDWKLEQDERGIYHPTWWNTILTSGDPTLYLSMIPEGTNYDTEAAIAHARLEAMEDVQ